MYTVKAFTQQAHLLDISHGSRGGQAAVGHKPRQFVDACSLSEHASRPAFKFQDNSFHCLNVISVADQEFPADMGTIPKGEGALP